MACAKAWILLSLVFTISLFTEIRASGEFQLDVLSFTNHLGHNFHGRCCRADSEQRDGSCRIGCTTYFKVCLKQFQHVITNDQCSYGNITTHPLGVNTFLVDPGSRTMKMQFAWAWRVDFSLIIEAHHQAVVPTAVNTLVYQAKYSGKAPPSQTWQSASRSTAGKAISFRFRVVCAQHQYGDGCTKTCRPRDDNIGHFSCDQYGNQQCLPGWTDEYCNKAICLSGCSRSSGYCSRPNDCMCLPGWQGQRCDECVPADGCLHGTCFRPNECNCEEGWGGYLCNNDLNYCTRNQPCKNGGICTNSGSGSYNCTCAAGFTGTNCETSTFDCRRAGETCTNGGMCTTLPTGTATCRCPSGYSGLRCERRLTSVCTFASCRNGGTCEGLGTSFPQCRCAPGWSGTDCSVVANPCDSVPCQNGGICRAQGITGFQCSCPSRFTGPTCSEIKLQCRDNPCGNGGTCEVRIPMTSSASNYHCECHLGYYGPRCLSLIDYCSLSPCANGGKCVAQEIDYTCECRHGWGGIRCTEKRNPCENAPCLNGGVCLNDGTAFTCQCSTNYIGPRCGTRNNHGQRTSPGGATHEEVTPSAGTDKMVGETGESAPLDFTTEKIILVVSFGVAIPLVLAIVLGVFCVLRKQRMRQLAASASELGSESSYDKEAPSSDDGSGRIEGCMNNKKAADLYVISGAEGPGGSFSSDDKIKNPIDRPNDLEAQRNKTVVKKTFNDLARLNRDNSLRNTVKGGGEWSYEEAPATLKSDPSAPLKLNPTLLPNADSARATVSASCASPGSRPEPSAATEVEEPTQPGSLATMV